MSVELDGTLIDKAPRIAPDDHDFGVGLQWFMSAAPERRSRPSAPGRR
jgi:hypothetical protein